MKIAKRIARWGWVTGLTAALLYLMLMDAGEPAWYRAVAGFTIWGAGWLASMLAGLWLIADEQRKENDSLRRSLDGLAQMYENRDAS